MAGSSMTLAFIAFVWAGCGLVAFATHVIRRRRHDPNWLELPILIIAATLLGPVALAAVLTDDQSDI